MDHVSGLMVMECLIASQNPLRVSSWTIVDGVAVIAGQLHFQGWE